MSATLLPPSAWRNARKICSYVFPFLVPCVSSSISSTGPRLPLKTQLIAGSLFGFWVTGQDAGFQPRSALTHRPPLMAGKQARQTLVRKTGLPTRDVSRTTAQGLLDGGP